MGANFPVQLSLQSHFANIENEKKAFSPNVKNIKKLEVFIPTLRYGSPHNEAHCMHILKEFTYVSMHRQQIQLS